jgi:hypothetical protein
MTTQNQRGVEALDLDALKASAEKATTAACARDWSRFRRPALT